MKRIAIPVIEEHLSEYFGECHHYEIFEFDGKKVWKKGTVFPEVNNASELPGWLEEMGITDVVSFRVSKQIINLFASKKVNLFVGVRQQTPKQIIDAWLEGRLESDERIIEEITQSEK